MKKSCWEMESPKWATGFREVTMMGMGFRVGFEEWWGREISQVGRPFQAERKTWHYYMGTRIEKFILLETHYSLRLYFGNLKF